MRLLLIGLWLFSFAASAEVSFRNDREGESFYTSRSTRKLEKKALTEISSQEILNSFKNVTASLNEDKLCSFEINEKLKVELSKSRKNFKNLPGALYHLRSQNEIDDSFLKFLLDANEISSAKLPALDYDNFFPRNDEVMEKAIVLLKKFQTEDKNKCLSVAYKDLHSEIQKLNSRLTETSIANIYIEAYFNDEIDAKTLAILLRASKLGLHSGMSLKDYFQKIKSLRNYYPLPRPDEKSEYVTKSSGVKSLSRRQQLLRSYTDLQIITMGNIIKKLRARLEAPKIEILIYDQAEVSEVVTLEPMERFRFAIKLLRKEMTHLATNTYFEGRSPSYVDLMVAAFEIGLIPASELDAVAGLEEVWNPGQTLWQKAEIWVRTFSSTLAIVIPPPYGFLPTLGIVIIEATVGKDDSNKENTADLF